MRKLKIALLLLTLGWLVNPMIAKATVNEPLLICPSSIGTISLDDLWLIVDSPGNDILETNVFDSSGALVVSFSGCLEENCSYNVSSLNNGLYHVRAKTAIGFITGSISL